MKTEKEVDEIMEGIPVGWRNRWCGGENGPCACLGCVQTGNKAVIAKAMTGQKYNGDPEDIGTTKLSSELLEKMQITEDEWKAWQQRHKEAYKEFIE